MPTIALRVPTVQPGTDYLPGGQCYILFDRTHITVREVITAKIGAELRKARMGGAATTSLALLLPPDAGYGFSPLEEQLAVAQACRAFTEGRYLVVVNNAPQVALDDEVRLDRRMQIAFIHNTLAAMTQTSVEPALPLVSETRRRAA